MINERRALRSRRCRGASFLDFRPAVEAGRQVQKKLLVAIERHRAKARQPRGDWFAHRMPAMCDRPERVLFIDEISVRASLARLRGRARRGEGLDIDAPFGGWRAQTFMAGLTHGAMIASWTIEGAMNGPAFVAYVEKVPVPEPAPPSFSATSRPTRMRQPPKSCVTQAAGSCSCRQTAPI